VAAFALNCLSKFARDHTSGETLPQRYALPGSEIDPHSFFRTFAIPNPAFVAIRAPKA
jgi:hypothetical protein